MCTSKLAACFVVSWMTSPHPMYRRTRRSASQSRSSARQPQRHPTRLGISHHCRLCDAISSIAATTTTTNWPRCRPLRSPPASSGHPAFLRVYRDFRRRRLQPVATTWRESTVTWPRHHRKLSIASMECRSTAQLSLTCTSDAWRFVYDDYDFIWWWCC